ncbi:MAG: O-antigen ligase family protein [Pirellulaceae bacterium]
MLMTIGGVAGLLVFVTSGRRTKLMLAGCGVLIAIGLLATMTRSIWLAAILAGVILFLYPLYWRARIAYAVMGIAFSIVAFPVANESLSRFKRDAYVSEAEMAESVKLRPILATVAIDMLQEKPITGFGFGLYHKYKRPFHYNDRSGLPLQIGLDYTQHNVFLAYAAETGLLGLFSFLGLFIAVGVRGVRAVSDRSSWEANVAGLLAISVTVVYVVNGMFHDVSIIPMANFLLFAVMAQVAKAYPAQAWIGADSFHSAKAQLGHSELGVTV